MLMGARVGERIVFTGGFKKSLISDSVTHTVPEHFIGKEAGT